MLPQSRLEIQRRDRRYNVLKYCGRRMTYTEEIRE
jgi:hypothetical protein